MYLSLETLTSIIRTGLPILVGLIDLVNSVIIVLSQTILLRWLTFLLGSLTVILTVLLFFLLSWFVSSDASICSTIAFPPLGNSYHVFVSVSIDFPSYCIFTIGCSVSWHIPYDYSWADWGGLCDHLRDVPRGDIFELSVSAAASEFSEWVQVGIDVYIPHQKYQVKSHSSPWFSAAHAVVIVHRNHFFVCTKRINLILK